MKRSANDPSRHSFNGHTRRALGTALQSGSTQDVGGRRGVHGGEEGKDEKPGGGMQHGWGLGGEKCSPQQNPNSSRAIWNLYGRLIVPLMDFSVSFYASVFSSCDLHSLKGAP